MYHAMVVRPDEWRGCRLVKRTKREEPIMLSPNTRIAILLRCKLLAFTSSTPQERLLALRSRDGECAHGWSYPYRE